MTWLRWLLLALPVSWALAAFHGPALAVFVVSGLGVIPLAAIMGEATEALARRTGPTVGGLLNATFGNAAELILAIVALRAGLIDLVKASLTGSILGNLLLILGLSLVAGGVKRPSLTFNRTAAGMSGAMLLLAVVGLVMPALFAATHPAATRATTLHLSEGVAVVLGGTYVLGLVFSLVTHRALFGAAVEHGTPDDSARVGRAGAMLAGATLLVAVLQADPESAALMGVAFLVTWLYLEKAAVIPLVVGVLLGKFAAQTIQHHASEFFIGGFMLGVMTTHGCYWIYDRLRRSSGSS